MKKSTKIWLIIAIISNIAMLYFYEPMVNSIVYSNGKFAFSPNWESYVGLALFLVSITSGFVVFFKFLRSQSLSRQIFFSTIIPTISFVFLLFFFLNITTMKQVGIVALIREGLDINSATARYIWIGVICGVYSVYLLITYFFLTKPIRKLEKALEIIKYGGEPKKSLNLGGSKEFRSIENDLRQINEEIKSINKKKRIVEEN